MNKDLHDIDNLFKQAIDGHLEEVPPDAWQNIDHGLDKKQASFYKRRYFTVRAAAILLLLVGGVTIAAILRYHSSEPKPGTESVVTNAGNKAVNTGKEAVRDANNINPTKSQESVLQDHTVERAGNEKKAVITKDNTREYASSENSTYSAEKNQELAAGRKKSHLNEQNTGVRINSIGTSKSSMIVEQSTKKQQVMATEDVAKNSTPEEVDKLVRTDYVSKKIFDVNAFNLTNSLPLVGLNSSIVVSSSTQAPPIAEKSRNRLGSWSVAPMYALNMNLNRLKDDEHFRDPRNNSREVKRTEQETKSFTVGLGIQKEFGANIGIQTGLQYFSSQTTIKPKMIFAEPDGRGDVRYRFNCSSGDSYIPSKTGAPPMIGDSIRTNSSQSSLSYLQVPFLASYKIDFGRVSIVPSAGLQANFLLNSKLSSSLVQPSGDEEFSSSIDGLKSTYFSGVLQPQLNYKFNDRISFDLNPNINFSLSPINKETAVKTYQNMFSLGAGLRIKL